MDKNDGFGLVEDGASHPMATEMEVGMYLEELSDLDVSEEQKRELLSVLYSILATFVEMGFTADVCGLIFSEFNESSGTAKADGRLLASPTMETPSPSDEEEDE